METSSPQKSQKEVLEDFLKSLHERSPLNRPDLSNRIVAENAPYSPLFESGGLLSSKLNRDVLFKIMTDNGASVSEEGNIVTFSHEFSSRIDSIVSQFLQGIDSRSSSDVPHQRLTKPKAAAGGVAVCKKVSEKPSKEEASTASTQVSEIKLITNFGVQAVEASSKKTISNKQKAGCATAGGGGPVCEESKQEKTFAELIAESKTNIHQQHKQTPMTCLLCMHTDPNGSGICTFEKKCHGCHPYNLVTLIPKRVLDKTGKERLIAPVCNGFTNGSCQDEKCKSAHLQHTEYERVVMKNKAYEESRKAESSKASHTKKPKKQPQIRVHSQVRIRPPSSSSASQASHPPVESQFSTGLDPLMLAGLTAISGELSGFLFEGFDSLTERSNFMRGGEIASEAGSPRPRSYSPAVEVLDSKDDEQGGQ